MSAQVDTHLKIARPYALNQVADAFKVDRQIIQVLLAEWTHEQLKAHLEQFRKEDLMLLTYRRY